MAMSTAMPFTSFLIQTAFGNVCIFSLNFAASSVAVSSEKQSSLKDCLVEFAGPSDARAVVRSGSWFVAETIEEEFVATGNWPLLGA